VPQIEASAAIDRELSMSTEFVPGLVSIVIPCYKGERWLGEAIESCLAQTYSPIEIILVDDASPDSCAAIAERYAEVDARVRVLRRPQNGGVSRAFNAGFEIASPLIVTSKSIRLPKTSPWIRRSGVPTPKNPPIMTVGSPNWRTRAISLLKPVDVKSPGVEAWLISRENAALLYDQLKTRGDFREHSSPKVEIVNGQSQTLARTQAKKYTKSVQLKQVFPFYDLVPSQIDEGYSLEISPLLSLDAQTIEAAITCRIDQVEKLVPLAIDVPIGTQSQRVQIQVPQVVSWRLSERFRWPASEVLLLSCGVVANPAPGSTSALSLLSPLGLGGSRADALLMIEQHAAAK
jgi:hypothetical protein